MSAPRDGIRAVCFDLGDTIWHHPRPPPAETIERVLAGRLGRVLRRRGAPRGIDVVALQRALRSAAADAESAAGGGAAGPDYHGLVDATLRRAGVALDPDGCREAWETLRVGGALLGRVVLPDALPTLDALHARGFRLAAVTNRAHGGHAFLEELDAYALRSRFDAIVCSDRVGVRKPHPGIFAAALDALGVPARRAVHVGDRPDADVAGARRAGLVAVLMRGVVVRAARPRAREERPHATVESLSELLALPFLRRAGR